MPIVNPMLAEVGVDPKSVKYREFGAAVEPGGRTQAGRRRALLGGPPGSAQRHECVFGSGFNFKFLIGTKWGSKLPSNSYQVRAADLEDAAKRDIYTRFLAGSVMGFEFARVEPARGRPDHVRAVPRAAEADHAAGGARLAARARHRLQRLAAQCSAPVRLALPRLRGTSTSSFIAKLGQTKKRLKLADVLTNDLVEGGQRQGRQGSRAALTPRSSS